MQDKLRNSELTKQTVDRGNRSLRPFLSLINSVYVLLITIASDIAEALVLRNGHTYICIVSWFDIEKARCPMHMHEKNGNKTFET